MGARREARLPIPGAAIPSAPQRQCWGSSPPPWYSLAAPGLGRLGTVPCALPRQKMQVRGDGPWQAAGPALRLAGSCGLLQPPVRSDRVFLRPSSVMLKRLRRVEENWERVRWVLAAWLLCSRRECGPRDFAAASFPLARGEPRSWEVNDVYQGSAPEVPARW